MKINLRQVAHGFSLIKIMLVIGVLVVLADVIIIVMNPAQILAKKRDEARLNSITQIGEALRTYYAANQKFVNAESQCAGGGATWINCLSAANGGTGQLNGVPVPVGNSLTGFCEGVRLGITGGAQNGWCYKSTIDGMAPMIVYSRLEASDNVAKCDSPGGDLAWAVYSSADNKAGIVCTTLAEGEEGSENALQPGNQKFR